MESERNLKNRLKSNLAICLAAIALPIATQFVKASSVESGFQATPSATSIPVSPDGWRGMHSEGMNDLWPDKNPLLHAVHGIKDENGQSKAWAVGEEGALAYYENGNWTRNATFENPIDGQDLNWRDVQMLSVRDVWAVGGRGDSEEGVLAHFDGQNWNLVTHDDLRLPELPRLNGISLADEGRGQNFGWIVGNVDRLNRAVILNFDNGNISLFTGTNNNSKNLNTVITLSPNEAWAFGDGGRETWYNGESRGWPTGHVNSTEGTAGVDMISPKSGYYVAKNGRVAVYRGGCHDTLDSTPCWWINLANPVLKGGLAINNDLNDVDLVTSSTGTLVGEKLDDRSLVAELDSDSQRFWYIVKVINDPRRNLYGILRPDEYSGFAVGADGTILEFKREVPVTITPTPTPITPSPTPIESSSTPTQVESTPTLETTPSPILSPQPTEPEIKTPSPNPVTYEVYLGRVDNRQLQGNF